MSGIWDAPSRAQRKAGKAPTDAVFAGGTMGMRTSTSHIAELASWRTGARRARRLRFILGSAVTPLYFYLESPALDSELLTESP